MTHRDLLNTIRKGMVETDLSSPTGPDDIRGLLDRHCKGLSIQITDLPRHSNVKTMISMTNGHQRIMIFIL